MIVMRILILATILLFSAPSWAVTESAKTVGDNRSITKAVNQKLEPGLAEIILNAPYDGFYQIGGKQKRGDNFKFNRVKAKKSFPDNRWEELALEVAESLKYEGGSNNVGSRTKGSATAYVVFYKEGIEGVDRNSEGEGLALVMIDQRNKADPNMPAMKGISGKELYLFSVVM
jgi:hypothetical protein